MHSFHDLPPVCGPIHWNSRIDMLLSSIWELLTPAQRAAFRVTDIKEKWGELRLDWYVEAEVGPIVLERIDTLISLASDDIRIIMRRAASD